jgi:hypothetical protein
LSTTNQIKAKLPVAFRERIERDLADQPPGRDTYEKVFRHYQLDTYGISIKSIQRYGKQLRDAKERKTNALPIKVSIHRRRSLTQGDLRQIERAIAGGLKEDPIQVLRWRRDQYRQWAQLLRAECGRISQTIAILQKSSAELNSLNVRLSNKLQEHRNA